MQFIHTIFIKNWHVYFYGQNNVKLSHMTEALITISPNGKIQSIRYYMITKETLETKILSEELITKVLDHANDPESNNWEFTFEDVQIEILKREDNKIEFFASRDVPRVSTKVFSS